MKNKKSKYEVKLIRLYTKMKKIFLKTADEIVAEKTRKTFRHSIYGIENNKNEENVFEKTADEILVEKIRKMFRHSIY